MNNFFAWSNCIGIDPGLTGAVAQWDGEYLTLLEIPTFKSKGRGREVDWTELVMSWEQKITPSAAFLEQVSTRPGEGRSSAFKFGSIYGGLRGILAAKHLPTTLVTPRTWKKWHGIGADKEESMDLAITLFPQYEDRFYGPRGGMKDGVAEAALIAYYGLEKIGENHEIRT